MQSQESEQSCMCVRCIVTKPVPSQESEQSCMCVMGIVTKPVPSQESEQSCICVRGLYQVRKVSSHVYVLEACTKPGK